MGINATLNEIDEKRERKVVLIIIATIVI